MTKARDVASNGGLVLISTNTFTSVSTVSFDNVFTSTYQDYRILLNSRSSGSYRIFSRLRTSGTDQTGSSYQSAIQRFNAANTSTDIPVYQNGQNYMDLTYAGDYDTYATIEVGSPQLVKETRLIVHSNTVWPGTVAVSSNYSVHGYTPSTQFDGITFYAQSGTFTGTIKVYGYK